MAVNDPESFQCRLNIVGPPRQSGISDTLWHVQSLEAGNSTGDGGEYSSAECLETHPTCRQHSKKAIGIFFSVFCWPDTSSYKFYHFPQCNKAYILQKYDPWKFPHVVSKLNTAVIGVSGLFPARDTLTTEWQQLNDPTRPRAQLTSNCSKCQQPGEAHRGAFKFRSSWVGNIFQEWLPFGPHSIYAITVHALELKM